MGGPGSAADDRGRSKPIALLSASTGLDVRRRLNDAYLSTHFGSIRATDLDSIRGGFPFFRRHLLPHLPADRQSSILDLGCGYGQMLYTLSQHGYRHVTGIDSSPEQVAMSLQLGIAGAQQGDAVAYLRGNPAQFDVIFALDFLEHMTKPELAGVIDGVAEALRPGGCFIVQTVNAESPFAGRIRYGDLTHELAFTAKSIRQALRLGGFDEIQVRAIEPAVHGLPSAARWLLWRAIRWLLNFYLAVETGSGRGHILSQNLIAVGRKSVGGLS